METRLGRQVLLRWVGNVEWWLNVQEASGACDGEAGQRLGKPLLDG